jgi:hypothetical protein
LKETDKPKEFGVDKAPADATDVATPSNDVKENEILPQGVPRSIFERMIDEIHDEDFYNKLTDAQNLRYYSYKSCHKWSLSNRFLMISQGTYDARGVKQFSKINRQVKTNASPIYINVPKYLKTCTICPNAEYKWNTYRQSECCTSCKRNNAYTEKFLRFETTSNTYRIEDTELINNHVDTGETRIVPLKLDLEKLHNRIDLQLSYPNAVPVIAQGFTYNQRATDAECVTLWEYADKVDELVNTTKNSKTSDEQGLSRTPLDSIKSKIVTEIVAVVLANTLNLENWDSKSQLKKHLEKYLSESSQLTKQKDNWILATRIFKLIASVEKCLNFIYDEVN